MPTRVRASKRGKKKPASKEKKSKKKSAAEYEKDLRRLKASYEADGIDLDVIKEAHKASEKARKFLDRNDASHPQYKEKEKLQKSSKDLAAKHQSILDLEKQLKRRRKEEQKKSQQSTGDNDSAEEPSPDEAASRLFLELHQLFLDKVLKNGSTEDHFDIEETDAIAADISNDLRKSLSADCFLPALQKLDDLRVVDIPATEDGIIRFDVGILQQAVLIEAELRDVNELERDTLFQRMCEKLEILTEYFFSTSVETGGLTASPFRRDWKFSRGPLYTEWVDLPMPFCCLLLKNEFTDLLSDQRGDDEWQLLSCVHDEVFDKEERQFSQTLQILQTLNMCTINGQIVSRGPAMSIDGKQWPTMPDDSRQWTLRSCPLSMIQSILQMGTSYFEDSRSRQTRSQQTQSQPQQSNENDLQSTHSQQDQSRQNRSQPASAATRRTQSTRSQSQSAPSRRTQSETRQSTQCKPLISLCIQIKRTLNSHVLFSFLLE